MIKAICNLITCSKSNQSFCAEREASTSSFASISTSIMLKLLSLNQLKSLRRITTILHFNLLLSVLCQTDWTLELENLKVLTLKTVFFFFNLKGYNFNKAFLKREKVQNKIPLSCRITSKHHTLTNFCTNEWAVLLQFLLTARKETKRKPCDNSRESSIKSLMTREACFPLQASMIMDESPSTKMLL